MDLRVVFVLLITHAGVQCQDEVDSEALMIYFFGAKLKNNIDAHLLRYTSENGTIPPGLSEFCARDYSRYLTALAVGPELWALNMKDSDGKLESGQMLGNLVSEGMYTECRNVYENESNPEAIHGQYCLAWWVNTLAGEIGTWYTQGLGYCIPDTCNNDDAEILLRADYAMLTPFDKLTMNCVRDPVLADDPAAIVSITILSLFGFIVAVATIYHVIKTIRKAQSDSDSAEAEHKTIPTNGIVSSQKPQGLDNTNQERGIVLNTANVNMDKPADASGTSESVTLKQFRSVDPESVEIATNTNNNSNTDKTTQKSSILERLERLLLSFSLYVTIPKIITAKHAPGSFQCINGLRFLAMAWIVLGHTYQLGPWIKVAPNLENRFDYFDKIGKPIHYTINQMEVSVDTFFVISGFLVTISFLKQLKRANGRLSVVQWIMYYVHRYWRLTPVYMIVMMIYANLFHYFGNGPFMTEYIADSDGCKTVWWKLLLYVQNLWYEDCMGWAWYMANDMQFHIIAPLFLCILYWNKIAGLIGLGLAFSGGLIANIFLYHKAYVKETLENYFVDIYIKPWTRCTTYFMGMMLGYIIYKTGVKVKVPKVLVLLGWFVAISLCFVVVYARGTTTCEPADSDVCGPWTKAGEVTFRSLQGTMWGFIVCWIMFACLTGNGGIFNTILSWKFFVPLAKLSYVGYLLHPIFCYLFFYGSPTQVFYYDYFFVYLFGTNIMLTMCIGLVISAVFEVPFMEAEKVIFPSRK